MAKGKYFLICEDASHLGGPMGTEYTDEVFKKPFMTLAAAKEYARRYAPDKPEKLDWQSDGHGRWHVDARTHIFVIEYKLKCDCCGRKF